MTPDEKKVIESHLSDRLWRLNNLYYIVDQKGNRIRFNMNAVQQEVYNNMHFKNVILKSRQHGITTLYCILILDYAIFNKDKQCGIITHGLPESKKIFRTKIIYAFNRLPEFIRKCPIIDPEKSNACELILPNGSEIIVATGLRSGTNHWVHISEHGKICAKFPEKAAEVKSGTQETVHEGCVITYESTAEGPVGDFYDKCTTAERRQKKGLPAGPLDYKFFFFPWYLKESNQTDPSYVDITEDDHDYFDRLEKSQKVKISLRHRAWYVKKKEDLKELMTQEHPSTPREAFHSTVKGAFWADEINQLESRRPPQITNVPHNPNYPVHTIHDVGYTWSVWFVQEPDGVYPKFINHMRFVGGGTERCCDMLTAKKKQYGYRYGKHIVPLDADSNATKVIDGKTIITHARKNGYIFSKIKKVDNAMTLIEQTRQSITDFYFDEEKCQEGIESLVAFRRKIDKTNSTDRKTIYLPKYIHDDASHSSTALYHFVRARHLKKFSVDAGEYTTEEINRLNKHLRQARA